jgi:hypothetical protein
MKNYYLEKARKVLSPLELRLFMIMNGRNGTLFLTGHPGAAKSAILRSIAKKMGFRFMPMWAPAMDEMDVGLYPSKTTFAGVECVDYVPPKWALEANAEKKRKRGVIVVIEEFNRNEKLMNASLSITNERQIAHRINFEDHVLFAVTGNLGDEDGTSVEILDAAQDGRMIKVKLTLEGNEGLEYWKENFALVKSEDYPEGRIHKDIIAFLNHKPAALRPVKTDSKNDGALQVDARRWTQLSDYITNNFGHNAPWEDYGPAVQKEGKSYLGNYVTEFVKFVTENVRPTLKDVLKGKAKTQNRDNQAEILHEAIELEQAKAGWFDELKAKELSNLIEFLKDADDDARSGFIIEILDASWRNTDNVVSENAKKLYEAFPTAVTEYIEKQEK